MWCGAVSSHDSNDHRAVRCSTGWTMAGHPDRFVDSGRAVGMWCEVEYEQLAERHVGVAVFRSLANVFALKTGGSGVGEFTLDLSEVPKDSERHDDVGTARRDVGSFDRNQTAELPCCEPLVVVLLQVRLDRPTFAFLELSAVVPVFLLMQSPCLGREVRAAVQEPQGLFEQQSEGVSHIADKVR